MVMLRPKGKASKIAEQVMKKKGVKVPSSKSDPGKMKLQTPYLQHQEFMKHKKKEKKEIVMTKDHKEKAKSEMHEKGMMKKPMKGRC